jgi:hypothetical protein
MFQRLAAKALSNTGTRRVDQPLKQKPVNWGNAMINVTHPSPTSLHVTLGTDSQKPSASLNFQIADSIGLGAKLHIPGEWLDKTHASLSPVQQKMFDVALKVLGGQERPRSVQRTSNGRTIQLDRPAYGATTLSIGFHASMSGVLDFLGMRDGKGKDLLTLGAKVANALLGPASSSRPDGPRLPARPPHQSYPSPLWADRGRSNSAPPLPPRPTQLPQKPRQQPRFTGQAPTDSAPPLPPRSMSRPASRPAPAEEQPWQPPPFGARMRASSFPNPTDYGPDPYEAHVAEERANVEEQQMPRPGMQPRLSQAEFEARLNGGPAPAQNKRSQSAPPRPGKVPLGGFANTPTPAAPPRASSMPPPRPPKLPLDTPPENPQGTPPSAQQTGRAGGPQVRQEARKPGIPADNKDSTQRPQPKTGPQATAGIGETPPTPRTVKLLYAALGLKSHDATPDEIKKAYKEYALKRHPDKNPDRKDEATEEFKAIGKAYEILGDETKRKRYDAGLINDEGRDIIPKHQSTAPNADTAS